MATVSELEGDMEENKVATREKLLSILNLHYSHEGAADAILQSPDLRVTLVEPRFNSLGPRVFEFAHDKTYQIATFLDADRATDYVKWLNSKEPK